MKIFRQIEKIRDHSPHQRFDMRTIAESFILLIFLSPSYPPFPSRESGHRYSIPAGASADNIQFSSIRSRPLDI